MGFSMRTVFVKTANSMSISIVMHALIGLRVINVQVGSLLTTECVFLAKTVSEKIV